MFRILPNLADLLNNSNHYLTIYSGGRPGDLDAFTEISEPWVADSTRCITLRRAEMGGLIFLLLTWAIEPEEGSDLPPIQIFQWREAGSSSITSE